MVFGHVSVEAEDSWGTEYSISNTLLGGKVRCVFGLEPYGAIEERRRQA